MRGDTIVEQKTQSRRSFTKTRQNSVRCGVPYSRLRAAAVRRDGRRRREVLECRVAVTPAAEVAWYVENVSDPADVTRERFDDERETSRVGNRGPETRGSPRRR